MAIAATSDCRPRASNHRTGSYYVLPVTPLKEVSRRPSIPRRYRPRNNSRPHLAPTAPNAATPTDHYEGIEAARAPIGRRASGGWRNGA